MSDQGYVRQDRPGKHKAPELSPQEDAARIEKLKASHGSHHVAGGCAEEAAKAQSSFRLMVKAGLL